MVKTTNPAEKNIPRSKQRGHRQERRVASSILGGLEKVFDDSLIDTTVGKFKDKVKAKRLKSFKKRPDKPLGMVLAWRRLS